MGLPILDISPKGTHNTRPLVSGFFHSVYFQGPHDVAGLGQYLIPWVSGVLFPSATSLLSKYTLHSASSLASGDLERSKRQARFQC